MVGVKERRPIRISDGKIRAILYDRYCMIDNYNIVFLSLDEFKRGIVDIFRIDLTETMLYLKAVDRTLTVSIKWEDIVYGGIIIRNSKVRAIKTKMKSDAAAGI